MTTSATSESTVVVPPVARLRKLSDEEILSRLVQVRGIGPWSVEMLLIFRLGRLVGAIAIMFVPREEVNLVDGTAEEERAFKASIATFFREKAEHKVTSSYGLQFSPHYLRRSRAVKDAEKAAKDVKSQA